MGTIRYLCPTCYTNRYEALTITIDGYGNEGFKCHSCFDIHTLRSWQFIREEFNYNEFIEEAYSVKRWNRVMANLRKRKEHT